MFPLFFVQVNIILNVFSLVFAQEKSIMIPSLKDNVCLCNLQIFFTGIDQFKLVDLPSKLSTHDFKLSLQQIQAVFTTFKITFRSLVCFFHLSCTLLNEYTSFHTLIKHHLKWF